MLGLLGLIGGWGYTAPPLEYKNRALGVPIVFLLMGPLMVEGSYFAVSGEWSLTALVLSIPVGLLVAAILHGNEWRDIREDSRAGISTISARIGRRWAHYGYVALVLGAYIVLALSVIAGVLPAWTMLAILSLPFLAEVIRSAELGATGQAARDRDDRPPDGAAAPRVRVAARARARALEAGRWLRRPRRAARRIVRRGARGRAGRGAGVVRRDVPRPARPVLAPDDDDRAEPRRAGAG